MIFHENRLPTDFLMNHHALFVTFEKAATFETVIGCKVIGGTLWITICVFFFTDEGVLIRTTDENSEQIEKRFLDQPDDLASKKLYTCSLIP